LDEGFFGVFFVGCRGLRNCPLFLKTASRSARRHSGRSRKGAEGRETVNWGLLPVSFLSQGNGKTTWEQSKVRLKGKDQGKESTKASLKGRNKNLRISRDHRRKNHSILRRGRGKHYHQHKTGVGQNSYLGRKQGIFQHQKGQFRKGRKGSKD